MAASECTHGGGTVSRHLFEATICAESTAICGGEGERSVYTEYKPNVHACEISMGSLMRRLSTGGVEVLGVHV